MNDGRNPLTHSEALLEQCQTDAVDLEHSLVGMRQQVDDDHARTQLFIRSATAELLHLASLLKQLTEEAPHG